MEKQTYRNGLTTQGWGKEGEGEMYGESSMETYITKCKWIANGNLFYDSRNSNRGSVTKNGWGGRWEGGLGRRRHGCNYDWFFLMYNRKPQNTVKQLSFNLNKERKKRKKMMKEKNCQPSTRLPRPDLWLKNCISSFLFLGSGSINCNLQGGICHLSLTP